LSLAASSAPSVLRGAIFLALTALCYAITGVLVRMVAADMDNVSVVFYRNLIGLIFCLPLFLRYGSGLLKTDMLPWHIWRTVVGLIAMYLYFYSLAHFTLTDAMLFVYSAPVIVPVLAHWILREPITWRIYAVVTIGLAGIMLVLKPGGELFAWMAPVGLACTLFTAFAFVFVRKLSVTEPAARVVFYFTFLSAIISFVPWAFAAQWPDVRGAWLLLGIGGVNTLAQWFLSLAYASAPAARIAPVSYLTVLLAALLGWLLWDEVPDGYAILGGLLIFVSALMVVGMGKRETSILRMEGV
jgi:drug/metabolite transporter (DMT)-like permease